MGKEITLRTVFVSDKGGVLDVVDADGVVVAQIAVPPGRQRASQYLDLVPPDHTLQIAEGLVGFRGRMGVSLTSHPRALESDANPDFQPDSQYRLEREMRAEIKSMRAFRKTMEAKLRARAAVPVPEVIPDAPVVEPVQSAPEAAAR